MINKQFYMETYLNFFPMGFETRKNIEDLKNSFLIWTLSLWDLKQVQHPIKFLELLDLNFVPMGFETFDTFKKYIKKSYLNFVPMGFETI